MNLQVINAEPIGKTVVERLEEFLEDAKAGKLSSVAIAAVYRDGTCNHNWSEAPSVSTLLGAIVRMQADLVRSVDE